MSRGPGKRNVFVMTRYRQSPEHAAIDAAIAGTLTGYGLRAVRADRDVHHAELWPNVCGRMDDCELGIAVFETIGGEAVSPNVCLELGYMLARGRRCLLLRDEALTAMPVDLAGHLWGAFEADHAKEHIAAEVHGWLQDLGLAKRADERLLVYVSYGGTCRDPMAKAITEVLLERRELPFAVRVEARGLAPSGKSVASSAAREAIRRRYGHDLLADHVPLPLTETIREEADLILVMAATHRNPKSTAAAKTHVLKPFFGLQGDVRDPYRLGDRDDPDGDAVARYAACCRELETILETNIDVLIEHLASARTDR